MVMTKLLCIGAVVVIIYGAPPRTVSAFCSTQRRKLDSSTSAQQGGRSVESNTLSKVETSAVTRFTIGYDKLCKNCPTRIEPRVDTLTAMILGLPEDEREILMNNVAAHLLERKTKMNQQEAKVTISRDVYAFQTAGVPLKPEKQKVAKEMKKIPPATIENNIREEDEDRLTKKMNKARIKFNTNKKNVFRALRLLEVTNTLLSRDTNAKEIDITCADNGWYHEIDRLKQLSRPELKMERLKLTAMKAKHDQKIAKQRMKLYGASMALKKKKEEKVMVR